MATINNIKKRADEIRNAYEPESVSAEDVGGLFRDIADIIENSIKDVDDAIDAATLAATYLSELETAISNLPDGQRVSAQVAENTVDIDVLKGKTNYISRLTTESDDEEIVIEDNNGNVIGRANSQELDYINIKKNGVVVATINDIPSVPTLDSSIGDTPSMTNVPTSKAVADYVDAHSGGVGDLPISQEDTQDESEEVIWGNDAGTQEYMKVGSYGIKAKAYLDMNGNPIGGGSVSVQTISEKKYLVFG